MLCHKLKLLIGKNRDSCAASSDTLSTSHIDWASPPQSKVAPASPNGALSAANLTKRDT